MRFTDAEARTASPFTPQPEGRAWATATLWFVAVAAALALAAWLALRPGGARPPWTASTASALPSSAVPAAEKRTPWVQGPAPTPAQTASAPASSAAPTGRAAVASVNKCLQRGRTTYSDGPCPAGATLVELDVAVDVNLMQAPTTSPTSPTSPISPTSTTSPTVQQAPQRPPVWSGARAESPITGLAPTGPDPVARCRGLALDIEQLDAMARSPQPGEVQDWITARKRQLRDLQFRLKC